MEELAPNPTAKGQGNENKSNETTLNFPVLALRVGSTGGFQIVTIQ